MDKLATLHQIETGKLTVGDSRMIAMTIEGSGLSIEPDARFTNRRYKRDERVILFPGKPIPHFEASRYLAAAYMLQIGLAIAAADGEVAEEETDYLTHQLQDSFVLTPSELKRLEALKALLIAENHGPQNVPRPPKSMSQENRQALGQFIVAMVVADGLIQTAEITAARLLFVRLGLNPSDIDRTLTVTTAPSPTDDLVLVQEAKPGQPGELIPPLPLTQTPLKLSIDREAVARIMLETREVAMLLAEAMAVDEEDAAIPEAKPVTEPAQSLPQNSNGIPARYAKFYQVMIGQSSWPLSEIEALARQHNLMAAGAIEAINEWAFDRWGANLTYEDGETLHVEVHLLQNP
jgi:uncharacterized tellurite resistance protein B-like protein